MSEIIENSVESTPTQEQPVETTTSESTKENVEQAKHPGNSQAKKIREATEAKVASKYESIISDLKSEFTSILDRELEKRDSVINELKTAHQETAIEQELIAIKNFGVPEENAEDAREFVANFKGSQEELEIKLNKYFIPSAADVTSGVNTIPQNAKSGQGETKSIFSPYIK